ncbi:unnamed protein product [Mytilus edulis]|uniref:Uncharacterized protein n=1 Tax=Mytilus edulis TaxID=6550 RepID=A0A8S3R7Q4_MYTED|nr:unnamed protein product [Mytilus edulis]
MQACHISISLYRKMNGTNSISQYIDDEWGNSNNLFMYRGCKRVIPAYHCIEDEWEDASVSYQHIIVLEDEWGNLHVNNTNLFVYRGCKRVIPAYHCIEDEWATYMPQQGCKRVTSISLYRKMNGITYMSITLIYLCTEDRIQACHTSISLYKEDEWGNLHVNNTNLFIYRGCKACHTSISLYRKMNGVTYMSITLIYLCTEDRMQACHTSISLYRKMNGVTYNTEFIYVQRMQAVISAYHCIEDEWGNLHEDNTNLFMYRGCKRVISAYHCIGGGMGGCKRVIPAYHCIEDEWEGCKRVIPAYHCIEDEWGNLHVNNINLFVYRGCKRVIPAYHCIEDEWGNSHGITLIYLCTEDASRMQAVIPAYHCIEDEWGNLHEDNTNLFMYRGCKRVIPAYHCIGG